MFFKIFVQYALYKFLMAQVKRKTQPIDYAGIGPVRSYYRKAPTQNYTFVRGTGSSPHMYHRYANKAQQFHNQQHKTMPVRILPRRPPTTGYSFQAFHAKSHLQGHGAQHHSYDLRYRMESVFKLCITLKININTINKY